MSTGLGQTQRKIMAELGRHPDGMSASELVWNVKGIAVGGPGGYSAACYFRRALRSMERRKVATRQPGFPGQLWLLTDLGAEQAGPARKCRRHQCPACMRAA